MKLLRTGLLILILGAVIIFAVENWSPTVPLVILNSQIVALPLALWLVIACGLGMLTVVAIALCLRILTPSVAPVFSQRPPDPIDPSPESRDRPRNQSRSSRPFWQRSPSQDQAPRDAGSPQPLEDWEEFSRPRYDWDDSPPRSETSAPPPHPPSSKASSPSSKSSWFSPKQARGRTDVPKVTEVEFEEDRPSASRFTTQPETWEERERPQTDQWSDRSRYTPKVPDPANDHPEDGYQEERYQEDEHREDNYQENDYQRESYRDYEYGNRNDPDRDYPDRDYRDREYPDRSYGDRNDYRDDRYDPDYTYNDYAGPDARYQQAPTQDRYDDDGYGDDGYGDDGYGDAYREPYQQQARTRDYREPDEQGGYRDDPRHDSPRGGYARETGPDGYSEPVAETPSEQFIIDYGDEAALDAFETTLGQSPTGQYRWKRSTPKNTTDESDTEPSDAETTSTVEEDWAELNDWEGWEETNQGSQGSAESSADEVRPIREVQRNPITTQQSGSVYSYSYRRREEATAETQPPGTNPNPEGQPSGGPSPSPDQTSEPESVAKTTTSDGSGDSND